MKDMSASKATNSQPDKSKDIFQAAKYGDIATLQWLIDLKHEDINKCAHSYSHSQ